MLRCIAVLLVACAIAASASSDSPIEWWLTTANGKYLLSSVAVSNASSPGAASVPIVIDVEQQRQEIEGFGFCLTGGSAQLIRGLPDAQRRALLNGLFSSPGIGISFLRVTLAASDLSSFVFSYEETPQANFSLGPDLDDVVPVLQEIVAIRPSLRILASPWSAPVWMKNNSDSVGGSLLTQHYADYADYVVNYVQAMQRHGIAVYAVTPQNEPLNPYNNPSMYMTAAEQAKLVGQYLGPAFARAGVTAKIIIYDHNPDVYEYPIEVLSDPVARQYVYGSAFHLYAGSMSALTLVHDAYPDKGVFFTEQWVGAPSDFGPNLLWGVANLIVAGTQNWCRTVLEWNLANSPSCEPHTPGGCSNCLGGITIDPNNASAPIIYNEGYYIIGHASTFVLPGSRFVAQSSPSTVCPNSAFVRPDGKLALVIVNPGDAPVAIDVQSPRGSFTNLLPETSVSTFVW